MKFKWERERRVGESKICEGGANFQSTVYRNFECLQNVYLKTPASRTGSDTYGNSE